MLGLILYVLAAVSYTASADVIAEPNRSKKRWYALGSETAVTEWRMLAQGGKNGKCQVTPSAAQGPFYTPGVDPKPSSQSYCASSLAGGALETQNLTISGQLFRAGNCRNKEKKNWEGVNAKLELWQADNNGDYDNHGHNCRTTIMLKKEGKYNVETIVPANYGDGNCLRPAHVHVKVTADGFEPLVTQLYFRGDPYLGRNDCACGNSCNSGEGRLQRPLVCESGQCTSSFNFYLEKRD